MIHVSSKNYRRHSQFFTTALSLIIRCFRLQDIGLVSIHFYLEAQSSLQSERLDVFHEM